MDVGANDGLTGNNTKHLEELGWIVLCVEPNPNLEKSGRENRKLWRNVACGSRNEDSVDFKIVGEFPHASLSGMHCEEGPSATIVLQGNVTTVKVPVRTLNCLLEQAGFPRLDLLCVDVEGHEMETLRGLDFDLWKPTVIVCEAWTPEREAEQLSLLEPIGYQLVSVREWDRVFVNVKVAGILEKL